MTLTQEKNATGIIMDEKASNALAARVYAGEDAWVFKHHVGFLGEKATKGKWRLYARVKGVKKPGAALTGDAFKGGVYFWRTKASPATFRVPASEITEEYKLFDLGTVSLHIEEYIYISSLLSPGLSAIDVDRLYVVPVKEAGK